MGDRLLRWWRRVRRKAAVVALIVAAFLAYQAITQGHYMWDRGPQGVGEPLVGAVPWCNDTVFYEVFVRSFRDSDGDGNGDLRGLISRLDYLNDGDPSTTHDLGVTGLWLMPVTQSPSYHGYDTTDYNAVDEDYGTADDFRELVEQAHARGIRVIVDLTLNHTSDQHPWFLASASGPGSPKRDWYVWSPDDPLAKDNDQVWLPANGGHYFSLFGTGVADLNLRNPEVTAQMFDVARFWVQDMGVDGFRLDAVRHLIEQGTDFVILESQGRSNGSSRATGGDVGKS